MSARELPVTKCIECKSPLNEGAVLCPVCKSDQSRWKNYLRYWASVITVFSVVASAVVFMVTNLPGAWKIVHWTDDVHLLAFKSSEYVTVANVGDGPVYLSHVRLSFHSQPLLTDMIHQIGTTIPVSSVESHSLISNTAAHEPRLALNVSDEQWKYALEQMAVSTAGGTRCYEIIAFAEGDPILLGLREQHGSALRPLAAAGTLYWYSPHARKTFEYTFDAVGFIAQSDGKECHDGTAGLTGRSNRRTSPHNH